MPIYIPIYCTVCYPRFETNCVFLNSTGVSKAILTAAGPVVQAELARGRFQAFKHITNITLGVVLQVKLNASSISASCFIYSLCISTCKQLHVLSNSTNLFDVIYYSCFIFHCFFFPSVSPAVVTCTTGHGLLRCKEIFHASFKSDPQVIQKNCKQILQHCEKKGYRSVSFPAINTGLYAFLRLWV